MTEPWNLRQDDTRSADSIPTFIIFCEDGEIEPEYFNALATPKIQISLIRNLGQYHKLVDYATKYCNEHDLLEVVDGKQKLKLNDGAQVWCVFDRDHSDDESDFSFSNAIDSAITKGMKVAWSNDNFELWILLHFEDVPSDSLTYGYRQKYYERLTAILKTMNPKTDEEKVIDSPRFSYDPTMKNKKRFISITLQRMKGNTALAIQRSKKLEESHSQPPPKAYHEKCPCTMVHHLVEELIKNGGKEL